MNQTLNIIRLIIIVGPSPGILVASININSPVFTLSPVELETRSRDGRVSIDFKTARLPSL